MEIKLIDITRPACTQVQDVHAKKKRKKLFKRFRRFWKEWGVTWNDLWGLLAAICIMIQLPFILWIFATTLP